MIHQSFFRFMHRLVQIFNTLTVILKSSIKQALTTRAVVKQQKFHPNFMQCRSQPDFFCPHTMIFNTLCSRTPTTPRNMWGFGTV